MTVVARRILLSCFVIGLLARFVILWHTSALGTTIVDEQQYSALAGNILAGHGFAWGPNEPTSIRPPLYPAMLAGVWTVAGPRNLPAVRALQIVFALASCAVVYLIGARAFDRRVGLWAAAVWWCYPSFVFFNFLVLTETLFTLLLLVFVLLAIALVQSPRPLTALACGVALGLSALTRSVLWPLPLLLCPLLAFLIEAPLSRRLVLPLVLLAGYAAVITPWAVRNTRLQQTITIVDTMGGINLRMGNYEYTPDDRMWDAVAMSGDRNWVHGFTTEKPGQEVTEGRKDKWAQRKAIEYMAAHPLVTVRRDLIKFADFWGLEREFIAGVSGGFFSPPRAFAIAGSVLIVIGYVGVAVLGAAGMWLAAPPDWRIHVLLLLPVVITTGAHTLVFGHSRYHLPLMPLFVVYAAALAERYGHVRLTLAPRVVGAAASVAVLVTIWARQVLVVDLPRITSLLGKVG